MDLSKQYGGSVSGAVKAEPDLASALNSSADRVRAMAGDICQLADTLCGQSAPMPQTTGLQPVPNGTFDTIAMYRQTVEDAIDAVYADIKRIRARL